MTFTQLFEPQIEDITRFKDEYHFLSNFYLCWIEFDGAWYPSVEHAYVASKTLDHEIRKQVLSKTPGQAKRFGRTIALRSDWETVKLNVMEQLVRFKFTYHEDLKQKLIDTQGRLLEEGNFHKDQFWGTYYGKGHNHLGKILMTIRDELLTLS